MTTLDTVAEIAGVSRATVSRVVNNHPNVREQVRTRVQEVLREQSYQPHLAARALASRRGHAIGLIAPAAFADLISDEFFSLIARGVSAACHDHGHFMTLLAADAASGPERDAIYQRMLGEGYHGGAIVVSFIGEHPIFEVLARNRIPVVSIGRQVDWPHVAYVDVDNFGGARIATRHLLDLGHRRIAHIAGNLNAAWTRERLDGFLHALAEAGLPRDDALLAEGDYTTASGMAAMQRLISQRPTAVFAANDAMAKGAIHALHAAGLRVPGDVSVISFDGLPSAATHQPALTTVTQPVGSLGRAAVEVLYGLMHSAATAPASPLQNTTRAASRIVPTELNIRASTCAPSSQAATFAMGSGAVQGGVPR